jgi:adenylate cyclase
MAGVAGSLEADGPEARGLADRVRRRFGYAIAGANLAGAVVVFVFLAFVLPNPTDVTHRSRALIVNAAVFVVAMLVGSRIAWVWTGRRWDADLGWISSGRDPSGDERERTLRYPLVQQQVNAVMWGLAAALFTAINVPFSAQGAADVAITIVLGGLVTCAVSFLLGERLLRPLAAICLAGGFPRRPQLPGVAARALLSWTLGTGVVLLGLALIGIEGLHPNRFTEIRLSIVVLVLSVIGMVVGLATTTALARSVSDRIEALRRGLRLVEQGRFDREVAVDDASELGLLQAGFNQMLAGLRERELLRDLFGRQVGEDVVGHALEHGVELGGEAREAAALFVDLQGSTALAETRDPAEVVSLLNAFFAIVVEVVATYEGWVNKFEGDAALCVFGAPLPDPRAADHALAAARELRDRFRAELGELRAGIGVSAGRVVAGNIGAAKRFEYTVIGDPVNEAARLTELAKSTPGGLLASDAALSRAGDAEAARWRVCDEVNLRGRSASTVVSAPHD